MELEGRKINGKQFVEFHKLDNFLYSEYGIELNVKIKDKEC